MWGFDVEPEERFTDKLQARIPEWEVLNLGVSGYGTDQELLLFSQAGAVLEPRVVILTVCGNDVEEVSRRRMYGRSKPFFRFATDAERAGGAELFDGDLMERSVAKLARARLKGDPLALDLDANRVERRTQLAGQLAYSFDFQRRLGPEAMVDRCDTERDAQLAAKPVQHV